jgi:membrane protein implicated in regulation of membrane protease activity
MNPTAIDGTDGAFIALNIGVVLVVALGLVYAVLLVMAALGLTSFSVFERFRKKRPEEAEEVGIDDLF